MNVVNMNMVVSSNVCLFLAGLNLALLRAAHFLLAVLSLLALFAATLLHLLANALLNFKLALENVKKCCLL